MIFKTTVVQPEEGVVWTFADSGIICRQAPHVVEIPNGELLMVGIVMQHDNCNSALDVIRLHHKGMMIMIVVHICCTRYYNVIEIIEIPRHSQWCYDIVIHIEILTISIGLTIISIFLVIQTKTD